MSSFRFNPNAGLLEPGTYSARIKKVEFTRSKADYPMAVVTLEVDSDGDAVEIKDYLVSMPTTTWKIVAFCEACGLDPSAGTFEAGDVLGVDVKVDVEIRKGQAKKDGSGNFPDQNAVKTYILGDGVAKESSVKPPKKNEKMPWEEPAPSNDLPF